MNLIQMRQKFLELSGRVDLVDEDDYSDNGANFFINEGRKLLDRLDENSKSWASCFRFVNIGYFSVSVPYCRAIKEVWISTSTARSQMEKIPLQELVSGYLTGMPSTRENGSPLYYSPTITRFIPENVQLNDFEAFIGLVDVLSGKSYEYNTILLNTPVSEKSMVEVKGLYYSPELVEDTDENYWSSQHPMLLYWAAMHRVEVNNRNTQGANDWLKAITDDMRLIGFDLVEELIAEVDQIED